MNFPKSKRKEKRDLSKTRKKMEHKIRELKNARNLLPKTSSRKKDWAIKKNVDKPMFELSSHFRILTFFLALQHFNSLARG